MKIKKVNNVKHLIISSLADYSTDLISCGFENHGFEYLRLNRDQFAEYDILYNLASNSITVTLNGDEYIISPKHIESIYFRAPVFLRSTNKQYALDEQVSKSQWAAFMRNLIIFDTAKWVNHPVSTYRAENKLLQLKIARDIGLYVPTTYVGNVVPDCIDFDKSYIVKSLDAALFFDGTNEMFTYSTKITGKELLASKIKTAPVIIQEYLHDKTDIRVTVIGDEMLAVDITNNNYPIDGDWRKMSKESLLYRQIELPSLVKAKIKKIMGELDLRFGGMDMALVSGEYYFIEVNPTGEWGWLVSTANLPIDQVIVRYLLYGEGDG